MLRHLTCFLLLISGRAAFAQSFEDCYLPTECTGLSTVDENLKPLNLSAPTWRGEPAFPPRLPGAGQTITLCANFAQAIDEEKQDDHGWELFNLGCAINKTYDVDYFAKHGVATSMISGQTTDSEQTNHLYVGGAQIALPLGQFGTVTASFQNQQGGGFTTTFTCNDSTWTQQYIPRRKPGKPMYGDRCGEEHMGSHQCLEH